MLEYSWTVTPPAPADVAAFVTVPEMAPTGPLVASAKLMLLVVLGDVTSIGVPVIGLQLMHGMSLYSWSVKPSAFDVSAKYLPVTNSGEE